MDKRTKPCQLMRLVTRTILPAFALALSTLFVGCSSSSPFSPPAISSVTPSKSGTPNSVVAFSHFEFVSVQVTGQIFTYDTSSGLQVQVGTPYTTPCIDPSGMVIATIAGKNVMAAACYDTGALLTLTVNADGSLSPLGSVSGLGMPFPGLVLDGTNVLVPLFGGTTANGAVAKISIAVPARPSILSIATLASPVSGGVANAEYLALANGYIYITSGSESNPLGSSSTIQVLNEATMTLVGSPLVVPHSPQQIAVQGTVAYVTLYDATALESIDISNPAALKPLQIVPLTVAGKSCAAEPVTVQGTVAYIGCYTEGAIDRLDITNPSQMQPLSAISGVSFPQRLMLNGTLLLVTASTPGGQVYQLNLDMY
jgi:LVIVD repeat